MTRYSAEAFLDFGKGHHEEGRHNVFCLLNNENIHFQYILIEKMSGFASLFTKTKNENGKFTKPYYSLRNVRADRVLDVAQDGPNAGSTILWDGYAGENQQFTLVPEGDQFYIKCKKNGQFLTVENNSNGARVYTAPKSNQPNQKFRIQESKPGSK